VELFNLTDKYSLSGKYKYIFGLWVVIFGIISLFPAISPDNSVSLKISSSVVTYALFLSLSVTMLVATISLRMSEIYQVLFLILGLVASYLTGRLDVNYPLVAVLRSPALLFTAAGAGLLLVRRIEKSWHIVAAAMVAFVADIWSVYSAQGVTRQLIEKAPEVLNVLLLSFPFPGGTVRPMIGVTDYVFIAIFLLHSDKFSLNTTNTLIAVTLSLVFTVTLVNVFGVGLPAIPLMSLFFIAINGKKLWGDFRKDYRNGFK